MLYWSLCLELLYKPVTPSIRYHLRERTVSDYLKVDNSTFSNTTKTVKELLRMIWFESKFP